MATTEPSFWKIERQWSVTTDREEQEFRTTAELAGFRSVVLLGAAGAGKTVEAGRLYEHERSIGKCIRQCRLARYAGSSTELSTALTALSKDADSNTVFHLDALDEAMVPLRRAWLAIERWIEEDIFDSGCAVRITCRSAVWPSELTSTLRRFAGDDVFAVAHLQPLDENDVRAAAKALNLDSDRFIAAITDSHAWSLARTPLTLRMLLKTFRIGGQLPSTLAELFSKGLRTLAQDTYERFQLDTANPMPIERLLEAAEMLACHCVLNGHETVALDDDLPGDALSTADFEGLPKPESSLDRNTLFAVGSSGLCDSSGPRTFRFAHRQFAEYLAGRRLARMLPHQARSLLASPEGWQSGVAGPLRETASFTASLNAEVADWLASTDPEVIGLSDVADHALRRKATIALLDRFRKAELTDIQVGHGGIELRGLKYTNAEPDLRPVLAERFAGCDDLLECAIEIVESWGLSSLSDELATLSLDPVAPIQSRISAARAILKCGTDSSCIRLKQLIMGSPGDDANDLKGLALRANWPDRLSTPELLGALTVDSEPSRYGAYEGFVSTLDREGFCADDHRVLGLKWANSKFSSLGDVVPAHRLAMRIAHAAVRELDDHLVSSELISMLRHWAAHHIESPLAPLRAYGAPRSGEEFELESPLSEDCELRRQLIDHLVCTIQSREEIWIVAYETPGLSNIEDFRWLLLRSCDVSLSMQTRQNYLEIARNIAWWSKPDCVDAWLAVRDLEPVRSILGNTTSIALDSEEAKNLRDNWRKMNARDKRSEPKPLDPPPNERVLISLDLAETRDVEFFHSVCADLTLEPMSTRYGVERFLTKTPGWSHADDPTRSRIVESAKRLLLSEIDDPESRRAQPLSSVAVGCMAAIWLILEMDPDWLHSRGVQWWERWCWYILRELHPGFDDEPKEAKQELLRLLYSAAPDVVEDEVVRVSQETSGEYVRLFADLLELLSGLPVTEFELSLCSLLSANKLPAESAGAGAEFLLKRQSDQGLQACVAALSIPSADPDQSAAVKVATALLFNRPTESWDAVSSFIVANKDHGRRILEHFAHGVHFLNDSEDGVQSFAVLSSSQLGELAAHLVKLFPPETKRERGGFSMVTPIDSARRLRDGVISTLSDRADWQAIEALRRLENDYQSKLPWIRRPRARAERSYRLSQWSPIPIATISELLASNEKRLLRSESDVLDGIDHAIAHYGQSLHLDGGDSTEDLWNTPFGEAPSPKAEDHVSSKLCAVIRKYFESFAVVADREIEIHRRVVSRTLGGEPGSELDILVQVLARGALSGDSIRIPVEVKLSGNNDVKDAMATQLADRYIPQTGATHGVYVVAWMGTPNVNDLRKNHRPKWTSIDEARIELNAQTNALAASHGVAIRSIVVDCSLR